MDLKVVQCTNTVEMWIWGWKIGNKDTIVYISIWFQARYYQMNDLIENQDVVDNGKGSWIMGFVFNLESYKKVIWYPFI